MSINEFSSLIKIGSKKIGERNPTYIIAEAGVNHNGDIQLAYQLIDAAVEAGADAVKFQLFNTDYLIKQNVAKAAYQVDADADGDSQYDMLKKLEISDKDCQSLCDYAKKKDIDFLVTPFDEPSLDVLKAMNLAALKVSSTDLTNLPFVTKAAEAGVPLILSTGMSELSEVHNAVNAVKGINTDLILLQCTSSYPAPENELNLRVIQQYADEFGVLAGYSDHSEGIGASPFAVAAGARLIEKHFTLDKSLPGPDHKASLSPQELSAFVHEIRRVDIMLGSAVKSVELCERENRLSLQKSLVAARSIRAGERFDFDNIVAKRTGGEGLPANFAIKFYGAVAKQDFAEGDLIVG